jgi:hypothetical protein
MFATEWDSWHFIVREPLFRRNFVRHRPRDLQNRVKLSKTMRTKSLVSPQISWQRMGLDSFHTAGGREKSLRAVDSQ